jgi:hypothetical protein
MEAETYARSICNPAGNYRNEETDEVKPFWRVSREKFAELIVQECVKSLRKAFPQMTPNEIANMLLKVK